MKIALCLSGQARSFKKGYEYIKRNLLDVYDVDIFFHTWLNPNIDISHIYDYYKVKHSICELPLKDTFQKYTRIPSPKYPAYFTVSAFYSIWQANEFKKQHEAANNFKYDWVVRCRFDYALNGTPDFESLSNKLLYIPNCRLVVERDFGNDQFAFSSSENIDEYSSTYTYLDKFYDSGVTMIGEDMLQANLRRANLVGKNLVYVDVHNPFPPGPHNGTWHSLIRDDYENWTTKR